MPFNLFGQKAKANLATVRQQRDEAIDESLRLAQVNDTLIKKLRDIDQLVYAMSQCTDWPTMRPIFNQLQKDTESRMIEESNRIRDKLIPEIRKVYEK